MDAKVKTYSNLLQGNEKKIPKNVEYCSITYQIWTQIKFRMIQVDVAEERNEILKRYRRLLRQAKPILKPGDTKLIKKAFTI